MTLRRLGNTPLLTRRDIPDMAPDIVDPSSVFNPGAIQKDGLTVLLLRVQTRGRRTFTVPAVSDSGLQFQVAPQPTVFDWNSQRPQAEIFHIYDARITQVENEILVVTAVDTDPGCQLALWRATGKLETGFLGLDHLQFAGWSGFSDTRNGVLFPEKIDGQFVLLERPNQDLSDGISSCNPSSGHRIVLSRSTDLQNWSPAVPVMEGRFHYWDELIGSGPPPVKTRHGWLHIYHGIATHFQAANIYQAGAVLLDLDHPEQVIGRCGDNILEPRESWELTGQVPNVVFPGGMTATEIDAEGFVLDSALLRVYYGAADTVVGLAQCTVEDLVSACLNH